MTQINSHYYAEAMGQKSTFIGSLNILGNPTKVIRALKGEVELQIDPGIKKKVNFKAKKNDFFSRGMKNLAGTVSNITGGVAGTVSLLSADSEYLAQRGKRKKKKAKGVVDGLGKGAKSVFSGVFGGIAGVVKQPVKGLKKGGGKGFLKGIGKGLTGLVSKPVVGVLDGVSKTAEVRFSPFSE
jgi:vacuolar protein sorting-associated protein 13A/C